jgi:hypothetical protein
MGTDPIIIINIIIIISSSSSGGGSIPITDCVQFCATLQVLSS